MARIKSSFTKWIFLVLFVAIAAAVAFIAFRKGDKGIEVTVREVAQGDITSLVTATGKVHPEVEVVISSEVPGEIVEMPVADGDSVDKGDLLVRVNPDTLDAQVKQQEAGLASARASSAQRRAEMAQAKLDLKRIEDLYEKGFATQDELEQARTRLEVNRAAHESSLHQIDRQEMQLREASDQLAKASTYSPISGTVILLAKEIGDRVVGTGQFAGTEIMRVADLTSMEVRIQVSEADIIHVGIGDKATVEIDAIPDETFPGYVTEIANSAVTTGQRSQEELTTFEVKIRLDGPGKSLRPGMTATADIETATVEAVVKAPLGAVVVRPRREVEKESDDAGQSDRGERSARQDGPDDGNRNGRTEDRVRVVFTTEGNVAHMRKVETGIADRDFIEIKTGLQEGDRIITGPYRALTRELKDESPITIREDNRGKPGSR